MADRGLKAVKGALDPGSGAWRGVAGQAQEAFGDDVELDVGGAAADGEGAGEEDGAGPAGAVDGAFGAAQGPALLCYLLRVAHAQDLADAAGGAWLGAGQALEGG